MADPQLILDLDEEQWLPIPGMEGRYSASSHGRIRSEARYVPTGFNGKGRRFIKERILKLTPNPIKIGRLKFSNGGREYGRSVAQAVAAAFHGPRSSGLMVRHLDDNPSNNRADNLAYGTRMDNHLDARRNGKWKPIPPQIGIKHYAVKLTEADVIYIRASRLSAPKLAIMFGVSKNCIGKIRRRESWKHI